MTTTRHIRTVSRGAGLALALAAPGLLGGCDSILEVNDPDIILEANSASGAIALKNGVVLRFAQATSGGELMVYSGLLADEFISGDTFEQRNSADQRNIAISNSFLPGNYRTLNRIRNQGREAIDALRQFAPTPASNIGLMFALTAFAENYMGELHCNGIIFSELRGAEIVYGSPVPYDSAFRRAINHADSALAHTAGTGGSTVQELARIVKGRALLNRGQFAAAAAAVAAVPTSFSYTVGHSSNVGSNQIWALNNSARRYVVADREGGNGLNFRSANDPRLPTTTTPPKAFDSSTDFVGQLIWGQFDPVAVATGIEARLIEAEAALQAGDVTTFLARLNTARATRAGLPPLTDPGSATARVDLLFRERAFWMFATGRRLGDLRRLIRQYGRPANTVFPTGTHFKGPDYGTDVNFPIPFDEVNNPNSGVTPTASCLDRNA
jgi:starch-binding outer membrane protein, SusD/RagB family